MKYVIQYSGVCQVLHYTHMLVRIHKHAHKQYLTLHRYTCLTVLTKNKVFDWPANQHVYLAFLTLTDQSPSSVSTEPQSHSSRIPFQSSSQNLWLYCNCILFTTPNPTDWIDLSLSSGRLGWKRLLALFLRKPSDAVTRTMSASAVSPSWNCNLTGGVPSVADERMQL